MGEKPDDIVTMVSLFYGCVARSCDLSWFDISNLMVDIGVYVILFTKRKKKRKKKKSSKVANTLNHCSFF